MNLCALWYWLPFNIRLRDLYILGRCVFLGREVDQGGTYDNLLTANCLQTGWKIRHGNLWVSLCPVLPLHGV